MKMIRLCGLVLEPYDVLPSQRFRIEQWEPYLNGIEIDYYPFSNDALRSVLYREGSLVKKSGLMAHAVLRRFSDVFKARQYDAVFLHRAVSMAGPAFFEHLLSRFDVPVIFDFDDSIYLANTSDSNRLFGWLKFPQKTDSICRLSDAITVGNSHLAKYAKQFNSNVHIVPTSIDTEKYPLVEKRPREDGRTVIGWTGSSTSQYHLEAFEPILKQLVEKRGAEIVVKVISDREPVGMQIPYEWVPWSAESEVKETAEIDIGIMPTPDDEWSRGKCAAKALQYMSLGIPAICTDMGANRDVVEHGKNGYLANTDEEWLVAFEDLIGNVEKRLEFGVEARQTVVDGYSMRTSAQVFEKVVYDLVRDKK